jgi:predicted MPP superfamily phosphohydrolase
MAKLLTRRQTIKALVTAGSSALLLGLYTWQVEPHWLELTYPELPVTRLAQALDGLSLAQISDIHVGPRVDDAYIVKSFRRVTELSPDFVAFTGDWITYRGPDQIEQLRRVLEHMPHGRLGTVGILGNHDYGFSWRMSDVADQVTEIATAAGVTVLRNQAVTIAGLQFVGLDDLWGPHFDPGEILKEKSEESSTIVLCHNPDAADLSVWGKYQGWILAGHTHGGQCKPPFLPPPLLPVKNKRYTSGEFDLEGSRRMYITRGVGHLLKVRFNARPEIPIFRLRRTTA